MPLHYHFVNRFIEQWWRRWRRCGNGGDVADYRMLWMPNGCMQILFVDVNVPESPSIWNCNDGRYECKVLFAQIVYNWNSCNSIEMKKYYCMTWYQEMDDCHGIIDYCRQCTNRKSQRWRRRCVAESMAWQCLSEAEKMYRKRETQNRTRNASKSKIYERNFTFSIQNLELCVTIIQRPDFACHSPSLHFF